VLRGRQGGYSRAAYGTVPDGQTVPRAELFAFAQLLLQPFPAAIVWTDHYNLVGGFQAGPNNYHDANQDIWDLVWERLRDRRVELRHVPSHLDDPKKVKKVAAAPIYHNLPVQAIVLNELADGFARKAAEVASCDPAYLEFTDAVRKILEQHASILGRLLAIVALNMEAFPIKKRAAAKAKRGRITIFQKILKRARESQHKLKLIGDGKGFKWRCRECLGQQPRRFALAFANSRCMGRARGWQWGGPHHSHLLRVLSTDQILCMRCQATGTARLLNLRKPCKAPARLAKPRLEGRLRAQQQHQDRALATSRTPQRRLELVASIGSA